MLDDAEHAPDRRSRRTRKAIGDALIRLVFTRRYDAIRMADLIEEAGVGRSTFYEHFRNKDEVLIAVLDPILLPLAAGGAGRGAAPALRAALAHMWERRAAGRALFGPALTPRLQKRLAAMIEARITPLEAREAPPTLIATATAAGQLAMLRLWLTGEVSCPVDVLARRLMTWPRTAGD